MNLPLDFIERNLTEKTKIDLSIKHAIIQEYNKMILAGKQPYIVSRFLDRKYHKCNRFTYKLLKKQKNG